MDSFTGEIRVFAFNYAPMDWAICDGSLVLIQQYTALYAIIGTRYGGDARQTFRLPNMQGYVPIGAGNGPGLTPRPVNQLNTGTETVTLTQAQIPPHDHTVTMKGLSSGYTSLTAAPTAGQSWLGRVVRPISATAATAVNEFVPPPATSLIPLAAQTCGITGGGQAHENRQPYLTLNFCVSLNGVFPVQE